MKIGYHWLIYQCFYIQYRTIICIYKHVHTHTHIYIYIYTYIYIHIHTYIYTVGYIYNKLFMYLLLISSWRSSMCVRARSWELYDAKKIHVNLGYPWFSDVWIIIPILSWICCRGPQKTSKTIHL